ncbi:hypothetical protein PtB15_13B439 [Puccinia triticina]|nr:hypothetical protein PtB15_13B439 [Puccinia triticina]
MSCLGTLARIFSHLSFNEVKIAPNIPSVNYYSQIRPFWLQLPRPSTTEFFTTEGAASPTNRPSCLSFSPANPVFISHPHRLLRPNSSSTLKDIGSKPQLRNY